MSIDLVIIVLSVLALSALAFFVVRGCLRGSVAAESDLDDVLQRAAHVGDGSVHGVVERLVHGKRAERIRAELPDALDMVANSLTAGLTLPQAILRNIEHFPPLVTDEFARVIYDTRLGFSIGGAFDNLAQRLPTQDVRLIVIATKIGVARGGNLADSYRMLSVLLRDNLAFEAELRAMTTEGRMQAVVMSLLPLAMMAILGLIRGELVAPLFTTAAGWFTLGVLAAMQGLAYLWIRKIVDIKV